jgi:hypothetical protein
MKKPIKKVPKTWNLQQARSSTEPNKNGNFEDSMSWIKRKLRFWMNPNVKKEKGYC